MPMSGDSFTYRYSVDADTRPHWSEHEKRRLSPRLCSPVGMFRQPAGTGSSQAFRFVAQNEAKPELAPAFLPISLAAPPQ